MKLRRNAVTILFLAAALLLGSAVNSVHGQGITYAGQAFVQKVQSGTGPWEETNIYLNQGDSLLTTGAVFATNMNTYLVKIRSIMNQRDATGAIVASANPETKFITPNNQVFFFQSIPVWNTNTSSGTLPVDWKFYISEDLNDDGDFNDAGEAEQEITRASGIYQEC